MASDTASDPWSRYVDPVRRLLGLGLARQAAPDEWLNYEAACGIGPADSDALLRMACDLSLHAADPDSTEVWAPVHAWRALGQLRAAHCIAPLLSVLESLDGDEAALDDLPRVLALIGPAAIPPIIAFVSEHGDAADAVATAAGGLQEIAARHPECRTECVAILRRMLDPQAGLDRTTSGFVVAALIDLQATEAIDSIRDIYHRDAVDITIAGDLEDVEIDLGLRQQRTTPKPDYSELFGLGLPAAWEPAAKRIPVVKPVTPRANKVGRNDPCPCGSGKKYKKCCLK